MLSRRFFLPLVLILIAVELGLAQNWGWGGGGRGRGRGRGRNGGGNVVWTEGNVPVDERTVKTAREIASHSTGTPVWTNNPGFERDVFTFCRLIRDRGEDSPYTAGDWITDFPDSDLNLSFRLQQMTAIRVHPDGRILRLTDPELASYPWIYTVEPGGLSFRDEEVSILRKYLLNGGVMMVDDFWGHWQWNYFEHQMARVFPDRQFREVEMSHPIFHCVFDLQGPISRLQTPGERTFERNGQDTSVTWEVHPQEDGNWEQCKDMHIRAIYDDKGRIMVIAALNCDNGDGWEREGENEVFFRTFSEKRAFPLGINIIYYLMTH